MAALEGCARSSTCFSRSFLALRLSSASDSAPSTSFFFLTLLLPGFLCLLFVSPWPAYLLLANIPLSLISLAINFLRLHNYSTSFKNAVCDVYYCFGSRELRCHVRSTSTHHPEPRSASFPQDEPELATSHSNVLGLPASA